MVATKDKCKLYLMYAPPCKLQSHFFFFWVTADTGAMRRMRNLRTPAHSAWHSEGIGLITQLCV